MRPRMNVDIALHAFRLVASLGVLALAREWPLQVAASTALFMGAFSLQHDLAHGALGLGRRSNDALLTAAGLVMLSSSRAMRRMHMRHHARPLADDDVEGAGARRSLFGAVVTSPANAIELRVCAYRSAPAAERATQRLESAAACAMAVTMLSGLADFAGSGAFRTYALVATLLQLTAGVWASHIPHHAPPWMVSFAARLSFLRSPTLLSLAFHDAHHRAPAVPCHHLATDALTCGRIQRATSTTE